MGKRSYTLGRRADSMAATRQRIVSAARQLFLTTDFHRVSLDEIAQTAGVGRTTIFEQFGSKPGLLKAVEEAVSQRAGVVELREALGVADARAALKAAFERGAEVWEREREMFRRLYGLAVVDREMHQVMAEKEVLRKKLSGHLARQLSRQGLLRSDCSPRMAREILILLTSFDSYEAVRALRGSASGASRLLLDLAGRALLASRGGRS